MPDIIRHIKHVRSNVVEQSGYPKVPTPASLDYGEVAINYANGLETISIKSSNNTIKKFTPNTNVYVKNFLAPVSANSVYSVLSATNVYNYQNFDISFLDAYNNNFDLLGIIDHIRTNFYDICDLNVKLNIALTNSTGGSHTNIYVNSEAIADLISTAQKPISNKSTIIGFTKYDEYFVAGDSTAMNCIEINWDKTTKAITVRYVYMDNIYRLNGNSL